MHHGDGAVMDEASHSSPSTVGECCSRGTDWPFARATTHILGSRLIAQCLALVASQVEGLKRHRPPGGRPALLGSERGIVRAPGGGMGSAAVRERG
jgi:hypothetical protein